MLFVMASPRSFLCRKRTQVKGQKTAIFSPKHGRVTGLVLNSEDSASAICSTAKSGNSASRYLEFFLARKSLRSLRSIQAEEELCEEER
jgi:hypothetical protein